MGHRKRKRGQDKGAAYGPRETPVGAEVFAGRSLWRSLYHSLRFDPYDDILISLTFMRVADER
jgi:hypothetical protein